MEATSAIAEGDAACAATTDVLQLWALARTLMEQDLVGPAAQCLEALCAVAAKSGVSSEEERASLLGANVFLAEVYLVACSNARKSTDRELWHRRVQRAEKCVASVDSALQQQDEWRLRLFKAKLLLAQATKVERAVKNRNVLQVLCEALRFCSEAKDAAAAGGARAEFRKYFGIKLKACLVKMYAARTTARAANQDAGSDQFLSSLRYLRANLSNHLDREFLLWLVEVSSHGVATSSHLETVEEAEQLVQLGDELFQSVRLERVISPGFHVYHLILRGFFCLRTGDIKKIGSILDEIHVVNQQPSSDGGSTKAVVKEAYLDSIVSALRLSIVARTDPCEALTLSMAGIHAAQSNLRKYEAHPAVRVLLVATMLDMLYLHCRLQLLQCRYFEMGISIAQMVEIFAAYKSHLLPTIHYRFFLGRIHLLIAKYAAAIGRVKEACSHLNYIVDKLLPRIDADGDQYPDVYLGIWVGTLEVGTYCSPPSVVSEATPKQEGETPQAPVPIKQIYPSKVLLEWTARVLERKKLRELIYGRCNVELRARYDLALSKWLWATQELSGVSLSTATANESRKPLTAHASLEAQRPALLSVLRKTLERTSKHVSCCEMTAEVMALLGPKLIGLGRMDKGEETLKNAIRLGLHGKNVLLQTRLLADVFQLYRRKQHVEAQAATAAKFEKKAAVLSRRVSAAQTDSTTSASILRWTSGAAAKSEGPAAK